MGEQGRSKDNQPGNPPGSPNGRPPLFLAHDGGAGQSQHLDASRDEPAVSRPGGRGPRRGILVEFARLIIVALFAAAGWQIALSMGNENSWRLLLGIVLGSGIGYVFGGVFGRRTASAVSELELELRRVPASEVLAGGMGLALGLVVATLLSVPIFHLPAGAAYPAVAFTYLTCGYLGYRTGRARSEEFFASFGGRRAAMGRNSGEVSVLDSSAILDGRIMPLVQMGFLAGMLLVTRGVVDELQSVADSSNPSRRGRGRRALDLMIAMKRDPHVNLVLVEEEVSRPGEPIDAQLVRLAKDRGGVLVTNDAGLARVAAALDVPVRSIHALAAALRPQVVAGEQVSLRLTRRGTETGQAVGYLDDGTMVVVEEADHLLGDTVSITVTNALQTATGQLVFGRVGDAPES
jgi:uncharacterized protein YacL